MFKYPDAVLRYILRACVRACTRARACTAARKIIGASKLHNGQLRARDRYFYTSTNVLLCFLRLLCQSKALIGRSMDTSCLSIVQSFGDVKGSRKYLGTFQVK